MVVMYIKQWNFFLSIPKLMDFNVILYTSKSYPPLWSTSHSLYKYHYMLSEASMAPN